MKCKPKLKTSKSKYEYTPSKEPLNLYREEEKYIRKRCAYKKNGKRCITLLNQDSIRRGQKYCNSHSVMAFMDNVDTGRISKPAGMEKNAEKGLDRMYMKAKKSIKMILTKQKGLTIL